MDSLGSTVESIDVFVAEHSMERPPHYFQFLVDVEINLTVNHDRYQTVDNSLRSYNLALFSDPPLAQARISQFLDEAPPECRPTIAARIVDLVAESFPHAGHGWARVVANVVIIEREAGHGMVPAAEVSLKRGSAWKMALMIRMRTIRDQRRRRIARYVWRKLRLGGQELC